MERQFAMIASLPSSNRNHGPSANSRCKLASFTLVELLVVLAIVAIITAATIPAITSVVEGNNISRAGQQVADQINLARQIASAKNTTVEMRIFKLSGASTPGYTEIQLGTNSSTGLWVPLNRAAVLPGKVAISEKHHALRRLQLYHQHPTDHDQHRSDLERNLLPLSIHALGYYVSDHGHRQLYPGDRSLPECLRDEHPHWGAPINNYVVVQINPMTGTPLVYRP